MRFLDMQLTLYRWMGKPDPEQRTQDLVQEVRDCINHQMDFIKEHSPLWWDDVEVQDIAVVAGTAVYDLSDFVYRPMDYWIEGIDPHHCQFLDPARVDMLGMRGTNRQEGAYGPYCYTFAPARKTSLLSGTCDITEGGTAITNGSGVFTTAMTGKRIRINGDDVDYVFTRTGNTTGTLDRAYRSRRYGTTTQDVTWAPTLTGVEFQISPGPVWQVEFRPVPTMAITTKCRYVKRWQRLINDNDVPTYMDERLQHMLLDFAKLKLICYFGSGDQARQAEYATIKDQADRALANAIMRDDPIMEPVRVIPQPRCLDFAQTGGSRRPWPPDQNFR